MARVGPQRQMKKDINHLKLILCSLLQVPTSLTSVAQTVGFKCPQNLKILGI
jgi:hypothetical protein